MPEHFPVRAAHGFPLRYISNVNARANHMFEGGPGFLQGSTYLFQHAFGLGVSISARYGVAVLRRGTGYFYHISYAYGPGVTNNGLPRSPGRNELSHFT